MSTRVNQAIEITRKIMKAPPGPKPAHFGPDVGWNEAKRQWTLPDKVPSKGKNQGKKREPPPKPAHYLPETYWDWDSEQWVRPDKNPKKSPKKAPSTTSSGGRRQFAPYQPKKEPKKEPKSGLMSQAVNGTVTNDKFDAMIDSLLKTFDPERAPSYVNASEEMSVQQYIYDSGEINDSLRNGVAMSEENKAVVSDLMTLSKPLEEAQVLYRGLDLDLNELMQKGAKSITFEFVCQLFS